MTHLTACPHGCRIPGQSPDTITTGSHEKVGSGEDTMTEKGRDVIANMDRLHQLMDRDGFSTVMARYGKSLLL